MIIKNKKQLITTNLRKDALKIIEAGIKGVQVHNIMSAVKYNASKKILKINSSSFKIKGRIFVVGGGKASGAMAEAIEKIIGVKNIAGGYVNCISDDYKTKKIKVLKASHPTPDKRGVKGVKKMLSLKDEYNINKNDLVICLISGGGSALMPSTVQKVSLKDKQVATNLLLKSGADIGSINIIRKHLSTIKGGQLGKFFAPSRVVSLILSDVIGDDLSTIASGPTVPDKTTFKDAMKILKKYNLISKAPLSIIEHFELGINKKVDETPKALSNCYNYIIGNNRLALEAMAKEAKGLGYKPSIFTDKLLGDPETAAQSIVKEARVIKNKGFDVLILGGETTPTVPKNAGKGGRNQHYIAKTLLAMQGYKNEWVATSVGTDGVDYIKGIAGAIIDNKSLKNSGIKEAEINKHLKRFDSNTLLKKIGKSLIKTGNTGTNVCDIVVYILK